MCLNNLIKNKICLRLHNNTVLILKKKNTFIFPVFLKFVYSIAQIMHKFHILKYKFSKTCIPLWNRVIILTVSNELILLT